MFFEPIAKALAHPQMQMVLYIPIDILTYYTAKNNYNDANIICPQIITYRVYRAKA